MGCFLAGGGRGKSGRGGLGGMKDEDARCIGFDGSVLGLGIVGDGLDFHGSI